MFPPLDPVQSPYNYVVGQQGWKKVGGKVGEKKSWTKVGGQIGEKKLGKTSFKKVVEKSCKKSWKKS